MPQTELGQIEVVLGHGCAGWYVEWYQEDSSAPLGYRVAHWYGSREACLVRMLEKAPTLLPAIEDEQRSYTSAAVE
jgi:hypothetical protein